MMDQLLFMDLGSSELAIILALAVLNPILIIICLINILQSEFKDTGTKIIWVIIVLLAPFIGPVLYLAMAKRTKEVE